jgi:hypothetical protein
MKLLAYYIAILTFFTDFIFSAPSPMNPATYTAPPSPPPNTSAGPPTPAPIDQFNNHTIQHLVHQLDMPVHLEPVQPPS